MSEYRPDLFQSSIDRALPDGLKMLPRPARLAAARAEVDRLERLQGRRPGRSGPVLATGFEAVDAALPLGGLAFGGVHEVLGLAGRRFAAALVARRLTEVRAPALWAVPAGARHCLYGPGLAARGIDPGRIVLARYRTPSEGLWVLEEALKSGAFACVLGEPEGALTQTAARRLQLAAEAGGALGLILSDGQVPLTAPGSATSRWRVDPAPAAAEEAVSRRIALTLERHRGAFEADGTRRWTLPLA